MADWGEKKDQVKIGRMLQSMILGSIVVYGIILYILIPYIDFGIFDSNDPAIGWITIALSCFSLVLLWLGYFRPGLALKIFAQKSSSVLSFYVLRMSIFDSVAVFGLMLGIIGAEWPLTLPFLGVGFLMLLITFPGFKVQNMNSGDT